MKHCSRCGRNVVTETTHPFGGKVPSVPPWNFCPWCGASTEEKMPFKSSIIMRLDALEEKVDNLEKVMGLGNDLTAYVASLGGDGHLAEPKPYTEEELIRMVEQASSGEEVAPKKSKRRKVRR